MTSIVYDEQIIPLVKIIDKNINNITFRELISLIFHALSIEANNESNDNLWHKLHKEFLQELDTQNKEQWPVMSLIRNDFSKRMDLFTNDVFIKSENFFTYLFRLLVVERYKRPYIYKSYNYHKVLGHKLKTSDSVAVEKLSITELFTYLKIFMDHYISVYNKDIYFEHQLGRKIFNQLDE